MLCVATGAAVARLVLDLFTLSWTHSVERTEWQETWRIEAGLLELESARVKGSGAGMDPPPGAVKAGGWYHYWPGRPPVPKLVLARSGAPRAGDYTLCWDGGCTTLAKLVPGREPVTLEPCR